MMLMLFLPNFLPRLETTSTVGKILLLIIGSKQHCFGPQLSHKLHKAINRSCSDNSILDKNPRKEENFSLNKVLHYNLDA